jgi:hypothetical protein
MTTDTIETTDTDPITEATTARSVLIERFETASEELSAAQRKANEIAKAIAEGVSAETVDDAALRKLFKQREDVRRAEEIAAARAEAIRAKGVEAEAELTRLIGQRNAILREERLRQYQADVEANEKQLLDDVRKLLRACEGRIVGDVSWTMGGSEALRYYLKLSDLTATAQELGVGAPFQWGTSLAENLLRHGIDGDPRGG